MKRTGRTGRKGRTAERTVKWLKALFQALEAVQVLLKRVGGCGQARNPLLHSSPSSRSPHITNMGWDTPAESRAVIIPFYGLPGVLVRSLLRARAVSTLSHLALVVLDILSHRKRASSTDTTRSAAERFPTELWSKIRGEVVGLAFLRLTESISTSASAVIAGARLVLPSAACTRLTLWRSRRTALRTSSNAREDVVGSRLRRKAGSRGTFKVKGSCSRCVGVFCRSLGRV
jgi:hypothetical protein